MAATPEIPRGEPQVQERKEEFVVPETIASTGVKVVQKTFKAQVSDDKGNPVIQTPPTTVISVTPPADPATLTTWSKGDAVSPLTWLGVFWLRILKKAAHFGWTILGVAPPTETQPQK